MSTSLRHSSAVISNRSVSRQRSMATSIDLAHWFAPLFAAERKTATA
jgi:hypothetical protein